MEVGRALEILNGGVMFFDAGGRYLGLGSSYDEPAPLFWPRGKDDPVVGGSGEEALLGREGA